MTKAGQKFIVVTENEQLDCFSEELKEEEVLEDQSLFGHEAQRHCMCEVPGQIPCPAWVPLPKQMTGKYQTKLFRGEITEDEETS